VNDLLTVESLRIELRVQKRTVVATRDVSFRIRSGDRLGIVGESGSGKSMTALALVRLLPNIAHIVRGSIRYDDSTPVDLVSASEAQMERLRGRSMAIVFQNALGALNPLVRVGDQIADVLQRHQGLARSVAHGRAVDLLASMGIQDPARNARMYPHQYSGGMAQRALIALALACRPRLLIADEPTTGLDPIVQAEVLDLLIHRIEESGASLIFISHDISLVSRTCTEVVVMYAGQVMESGPVAQVLSSPRHPYTRALVDSLLSERGARFPFIPGRVPVLGPEFTGCTFFDRCALAAGLGHPPRCVESRPALRSVGRDQEAACHFVEATGD
jgi:oligopeptide/dipeptide ABC transporter ATP-binding protein